MSDAISAYSTLAATYSLVEITCEQSISHMQDRTLVSDYANFKLAAHSANPLIILLGSTFFLFQACRKGAVALHMSMLKLLQPCEKEIRQNQASARGADEIWTTWSQSLFNIDRSGSCETPQARREFSAREVAGTRLGQKSQSLIRRPMRKLLLRKRMVSGFPRLPHGVNRCL